MSRIYDLRMNDGSRHFAALPDSRSWYNVRDHVETLHGARLTGFLCDGVTEAWIDFEFGGQRFSINDQYGEYWFFVDEPNCDDEMLKQVLAHFELLLVPPDMAS